ENADAGIDRQRQEDEQVADDLVRHPELFEDGEENDEGGEAAGVDAVNLPEIGEEVRRARLLRSHSAYPPQRSSSATPNSRSIESCVRANQKIRMTNAISEPCAAM